MSFILKESPLRHFSSSLCISFGIITIDRDETEEHYEVVAGTRM